MDLTWFTKRKFKISERQRVYLMCFAIERYRWLLEVDFFASFISPLPVTCQKRYSFRKQYLWLSGAEYILR